MKGYRQQLVQYPKDSTVVYTSGRGNRFTARVLVAHKDGDRTIRVQWPLDQQGQEMTGAYQGDKWRVGPHMFSVWQG